MLTKFLENISSTRLGLRAAIILVQKLQYTKISGYKGLLAREKNRPHKWRMGEK
jgi:hypothetical protein